MRGVANVLGVLRQQAALQGNTLDGRLAEERGARAYIRDLELEGCKVETSETATFTGCT
ncbi:hypothetical protein PSEUDO8O_170486 [Pseudomonas sp. 8O]|nr:hypothetical protein PSEUDO8O_170486 [Pseudomonas sp. 8O]